MSFLFSQKPDSAIDHNSLANLTTGDPHTQYLLLAGRAGGQSPAGGNAASENLTLRSTSHATKGKILFGTSAYDEVNDRLGVGTQSPGSHVHISKVGGNAVSIGGQSLLYVQSTSSFGGMSFGAPTGQNTFIELLEGTTKKFSLEWDAAAADGYITTNSLFNVYNITRTQSYLKIDTSTGIVSLPGTSQYLNLSAISAGNPNLKITATSDTPTVAFTGGGNAPTTAPAGYLEILVGASARYIPFWA